MGVTSSADIRISYANSEILGEPILDYVFAFISFVKFKLPGILVAPFSQ